MTGNSRFANMPAKAEHPNRAVRVLQKEIWEVLVWPDWQRYLQQIKAEPPWLGRPIADPQRAMIWFTDPESVFVCKEAEDFGERLALEGSTGEGCTLVFFSIDATQIGNPSPKYTVASVGLTAGGARQWTLSGNLRLDLNPGMMEAFIVEAHGNRQGPV